MQIKNLNQPTYEQDIKPQKASIIQIRRTRIKYNNITPDFFQDTVNVWYSN